MIVEGKKVEINASQIQPVKEIKSIGTFVVLVNFNFAPSSGI